MVYIGVALAAWILWTTLRGHLKTHPELKERLWKNGFGLVALLAAAVALGKGRPDVALMFGLLTLTSPAGRSWLRQLKHDFDGRFAEGRKTGNFGFGPGRAKARGGVPQPIPPGGMTKQEAYQLLGLGDGASAADVARAHRRLMKEAHPDAGGSTQRAARLNEAKDLLMDRHYR
jgi:hypothetical protein